MKTRAFRPRNQAALPSAAADAAAAAAPERRQGKQQHQHQHHQAKKKKLLLLSRSPSRRAEVILAATSLLPASPPGAANDPRFPLSSTLKATAGGGGEGKEGVVGRRSLLATAAALSLASSLTSFSSAALPLRAEAAAEQQGETSFYSSPKGFSLSFPPRWLQKSKPGAEVLFADPESPRATIGVTASPVRIDSLADFGTVAEVGDRLLGAELAKDGCLAATLRLASAGSVPREWRGGGERATPSPTTTSTSTEDDPSSSSPSTSSPSSSSLYYFEYELLTTRAHKVVVVAVGVASRTLYIFNGFAPCPKKGGGGGGGGDAVCPPVDAPSPVLEGIRRSASTFSIASS